MENNDILKNKVKSKIAISKFKEENIVMKNKYLYINKKILFVASLVIIIATGTVFAKDIKNFIVDKFGLGKGIETAVENGYIEEPNMNYISSSNINENITEDENDGTILNNINTEIKIDDFLIDDYNLSVDFSIKVDSLLSEYITIDDYTKITFSDLIITDENNNILYENSSEERFDDFCEKNNISKTYRDYDNTYMNCGLNTYLNYIEQNNSDYTISNKYNMYTTSKFPTSTKLKFDINKIKFKNTIEEKEIIYTIIGNWNFEIDVPDEMCNRTAEYYEVVNSENDNFNVYTAKVTDTGFEIGITISDTPKPVLPQELYNEETETEYSFNTREELLEVSTDENFEKLYIEYYKQLIPVQVVNNFPLYSVNWLPLTDGTYLKNSNGERFDCTMNPGRKQNHNWIDDNTFDFYETFEMTKSNATNNIIFTINYYGEHYNIELQKIT